ncbi:hypothetical protein C8F04DRAFT_336224 [Mycena alexandri]|uniref:Uncharacterized protein n=1 Tax=Mycena alexandri TaxID=1745969 RepID=A0AAD6S2M1_9AGAR|nr:hypothetical protein C8F04DRAFT_336224 [Mycena alexandri]
MCTSLAPPLRRVRVLAHSTLVLRQYSSFALLPPAECFVPYTIAHTCSRAYNEFPPAVHAFGSAGTPARACPDGRPPCLGPPRCAGPQTFGDHLFPVGRCLGLGLAHFGRALQRRVRVRRTSHRRCPSSTLAAGPDLKVVLVVEIVGAHSGSASEGGDFDAVCVRGVDPRAQGRIDRSSSWYYLRLRRSGPKVIESSPARCLLVAPEGALVQREFRGHNRESRHAGMHTCASLRHRRARYPLVRQ